MKEKVLVLERRLRRFEEVLKRRQKDLVLFVENVKNEHNFSAIVRTCDAVGVLNIYFYHEGRKSLPINEGITMGAHKWVLLHRVDEPITALKSLRRKGFQVVSTWLDEDSVDFRSVDYTKPTLIVVGNELDGVSERVAELSDVRIKIPMFGMVQSLNVSVATAVILYEAQRQREKKGMYEKSSLSPREIERIIHKWGYEDVIVTKRKM